MSALRYINITAKNNKFIVLVTLNLSYRPYCPSGIIHSLLYTGALDHPTVQTIMRFFLFSYIMYIKLFYVI